MFFEWVELKPPPSLCCLEKVGMNMMKRDGTGFSKWFGCFFPSEKIYDAACAFFKKYGVVTLR